MAQPICLMCRACGPCGILDGVSRPVLSLLVLLALGLGCSPATGPETAEEAQPTTVTGAAPPSVADEGGDGGDVEGEVEDVSVVDGDTFRARVAGREMRIRLIGINAPETGECLAEEAGRALADWLGTGPIRLEVDVSEHDQYGRLLRYVWVGDTLVNEALVAEGLALAQRYEPDTGRAPELEAAQRQAQSEQVGLWSGTACSRSDGVGASNGAVGGDQLVISHIEYDPPGDDNHHRNGEWVEVTNTGPAGIELTEWMLRDESSTHRFTFPNGFVLGAGEAVRIHSGCEHESGPDDPGPDQAEPSGTGASEIGASETGPFTGPRLYWCADRTAVWNNNGDTAFVLDPAGNIVTSLGYGPGR